MFEIFGAGLFGFCIGLDVIVAIRQTETGGAGESDDAGRVSKVLARAEAEKHSGIRLQVLRCHEIGYLTLRFHPRDFVQSGIETGGSGLLHGRLIHAGCKKIADLPLRRGAAWVRPGRFLQDAPQEHQVFLMKF